MDSDNNKSTRFAHSEGHVDICYNDDGSHLLTGGIDGDVRIWTGIDDDDPVSFPAGDNILAVAYKDSKFYSAADDNTVRVHSFPDGQPDGMIVRFTAPVTHMVFNKSGSKLYAGASDFHIKATSVGGADMRVFTGHDAPILSLALHPEEKFLASSSCDGTVKIWKVGDGSCFKTFPVLPKGNDFSFSTTLCRMTWTKDGKHLAVPVTKEVRMYNSESWEVDFVLKHESITETISVCALSPCGNYIAAGCSDGFIALWEIKSRKLVNKEPSDKKASICGLAWKPKGDSDLAYTDTQGNLGILDEFIPSAMNKSTSEAIATDYADLFDDDDDMMIEASAEPSKKSKTNQIDSDDDATSTNDPMKGLFEDDNSRDTVGTDLLGSGHKAEDAASVAASEPPVPLPPPAPRGPPVTPLQPAFQPASTPTHLSHRFMLWNSVGIIRQYNTEEENSIDVEFHDTATHHAIHVTNTLGHSMAALSPEALLLACESDDDTASQIVCTNFGAWDSSKEWSAGMPEGEEIDAIALGDGWAAVATDARYVRIFSVGGIQHEVFSIPGPAVTLSGCGNQLMVIYHRGAGLPGEQCLGVQLVNVCGRKRKSELNGCPLPLSRKATLAWSGFSAEGTPFYSDSTGALYVLNRQFGYTWTQVANTKSLCKGKSDHYWIVGIHENPSQIRAIMCKGAKYPPTLPRPNVNILPFQLPLCELSTDKGQLEEAYWRTKLLSNHLDYWDSQGYEVDETAKSRAVVGQQETLIKLFALACKTGREARALEISSLMAGQQAVQLAIKYASRLRKMQLAEKLSAVAREKAEEEAGVEEEEEREVQYSAPMRTFSRQASKRDQEEEEEEVEEQEENDDVSQDIYEEMEDEQGEEEEKKPMLLLGQKSEKHSRSLSSQGSVRANPFKVASQTSLTPTSDRGSRVFDNMKQVQKTPASPEITKKAKPRARPLPTKKKTGLSAFTSKKPQNIEEKSQENEETTPKVTAFQMWQAEHQSELEEEHPDLSEADLTIAAARKFKQLPAEEKKEWQEKASTGTPKPSGEKRKRPSDDSADEVEPKKTVKSGTKNIFAAKKPLSNNTNSKLAAFSFDK